MNIQYFTNEMQHTRLDCKSVSSKARAVGYPIFFWLFQFETITYDLRRASMDVLVVDSFSRLFQKQREPNQVMYGLHEECFLFKKVANMVEQRG